jgi:hypothetical protein
MRGYVQDMDEAGVLTAAQGSPFPSFDTSGSFDKAFRLI